MLVCCHSEGSEESAISQISRVSSQRVMLAAMPHDWKIRIHEDEATRVDSGRLLDLVARCYVALGLEEDAAHEAAEVLVEADLLGKETHGVPLFPGYVANLRSGAWNPRPHISIMTETPNTALVDGDGGPGANVGRFAMREAINKARD